MTATDNGKLHELRGEEKLQLTKFSTSRTMMTAE